MSTTDEGAAAGVDFKLEVVVIPVADVDRAKAFYESLGWRLDADFATGEDFRVVQFTPTGSLASIIFGTGLTAAAPGSTDALVLDTVSEIENLTTGMGRKIWQKISLLRDAPRA